MNLYKAKDRFTKVKVFPQGLAVSENDMASFVLFKDEKEEFTFPIWCPVLPVSFFEVPGSNNIKNPYEFTCDVLKDLDFKISECVFDCIESDQQYATLQLKEKKAPVKKLKLKAFQALALCGPNKEIKFFATRAFIKKTRDVDVFEKNNPSEQLKKNSFLRSGQKYLM